MDKTKTEINKWNLNGINIKKKTNVMTKTETKINMKMIKICKYRTKRTAFIWFDT